MPPHKIRGENPASASAEMKGDSGSEAESHLKRNPVELTSAKRLRQHKQTGELRSELGVIFYNFDKKEQVPVILALRTFAYLLMLANKPVSSRACKTKQDRIAALVFQRQTIKLDSSVVFELLAFYAEVDHRRLFASERYYRQVLITSFPHCTSVLASYAEPSKLIYPPSRTGVPAYWASFDIATRFI